MSATPDETAQDKAAWIEDCADSFRAVGCAEEVALEFSAACWDNALDDEGSEEAVLEKVLPEVAAEAELENWVD